MSTRQGISLGYDSVRSTHLRLGEWFEWWAGCLFELIPAGLRNAFIPARRWVWIQSSGDEFTVFSADGESLGTTATSGKARGRIRSGDTLLLLDRHQVLLRSRRLPASSESNLRNALRLQIAADTPFDIDEIYEDCRIVSHDRDSGQLLAEQAIIRRDFAEQLLGQARQNRIDLAGIDVRDETGQPSGFNLLPEPLRARADGFLPAVNRGLLAGAVILGLLVVGLYALSLDRQTQAIESAAAGIRSEAAEVLALQSALRLQAEAISTIEANAASPIRFGTLLDALAEALPEDSWLEGLAYDGKQVSLVGLSRSSDGLVPQLEQIEGVAAARIVSSVIRDERLNADRFRMELVLDPLPLPADSGSPVSFAGDDNG